MKTEAYFFIRKHLQIPRIKTISLNIISEHLQKKMIVWIMQFTPNSED